MSLEIIDYKKTIETLDSDNLESDEIAKIITDKYGIKNVTIGEKKEIIENIKKVKEEVEENIKTIKNTKKKIKLKHTKKSLIKAIEKQNISELESIQLNDLEGGGCEVYIFPYNNSTYVINNHKKIVGYMKEWIDEEEEVPEEFKTNDNQVLEPKTGLPMSEITISESGALYCNIKEDTYREYDYNESLESFIKTNRIIRFE